MDLKINFLLLFCAVLAHGLPTMYKVNENKVLEKGESIFVYFTYKLSFIENIF